MAAMARVGALDCRPSSGVNEAGFFARGSVDSWATSAHYDRVSDSVTTFPSASLLRWLSAHTGFPARRLPPAAETLLCLAAAASVEEMEASAVSRFGLQRREPMKESAQRAHALRRSQVHFKCDNSAKV